MRRATPPALVLLVAVLALRGLPAGAAAPPPPLALDDRVLADPGRNPATLPVDAARLGAEDPLREAWQRFSLAHGGGWRAHVDLRTGVPALVTGPGLAWFDPDGAPPACADVEALARAFVAANQELLQVPLDQLEFQPSSCVATTAGDLRVWFTQRVQGVPVEGALFALDVVRGRLVAFGGALLARVNRPVDTPLRAADARAAALAFAGPAAGVPREPAPPELRLVPVDPRGLHRAWDGARGRGLAHRLVWHVALRTEADGMSWSADVDADTGSVAAFRLDTRFGYVKGDVHPLTNDGQGWEGNLAPGFPMPFMDVSQDGTVVGTTDRGGWAPCTSVGLPASVEFQGRYWREVNFCGMPSESALCPATLDLAGYDGTDCLFPAGHHVGDDNAARDVFYHLNRVAEKGRYYFPDQSWYATQQVAWVNQLSMYCNGYIDADGLHYGVSFPGNPNDAPCRNFGQIEGVIVHEWGHGVGYHDGAEEQDHPAEAEPDAAALVETRLSCSSRGTWFSTCDACGDACLTCTGLREQDWNQHAHHTPWTWRDVCGNGDGPCGKDSYMEGSVLNQALFDLATRDMPAQGFSQDTGWQLLDRLYFQSRRNSTGNAYNCTYGVGTDGCGTTSWFHKFMVADDDDGNLANGTPHAAAIFAAFNRHEIACGAASDASNTNHSSCSMLFAPSITVTEEGAAAAVRWAPSLGAYGYRVLSTDLGCAHAQAVVATTTLNGWTDTQLTPNLRRSYRVQAVGTNPKCESEVSNCTFQAPDLDDDNWSSAQDCDDHDASVHPDATELCDGKDNDCDGLLDEGLPQHAYYYDFDLDGHGYAGSGTISACSVPYHYSTLNDDCADDDPYTFPGAVERCDGRDNACKGSLNGNEEDRDRDGWIECAPYLGNRPWISGGGDCDDLDDLTHPLAPELCDGLDNDCGGLIPEDERDVDHDGYVACTPWDDRHGAHPEILGGNDCVPYRPSIHPGAPEVCDGYDSNCDEVKPLDEWDHDADDFFECGDAGVGGGDCDDANPLVRPLMADVCDHTDNDCSGVADPAAAQLPFALAVTGSADFGRAVAALGDVDGDGTPDFAVGRPLAGLNGAVAVYSGATRALLCETPGAPPTSRVGTSVAGLSDLDGDGRPDFAAGAPGYDSPTGLTDAGAVLIYSGRDCHLLRTCPGAAAGDRLGDAKGLAALGGDVLAGAPNRDTAGGADAGAVYLVEAINCGMRQMMTDPAGAPGDHLGAAVLALDDLDGDGTADLAAGAPDYDARGTDRGEVLVFSGRTGAFLGYVRTGSPTEGGRFGAALARTPDLDHDAHGELWVGEPGALTPAGSAAGRVTAWSPEDQDQLLTIDGTVAQEQFGSALAGLHDRDEDGTADVAVGAPYADDAGVVDAGRVDVVSGRTGVRVRSFIAPAGSGARLGTSVAELGDVTRDYAPELIAGAPGQNVVEVLGTDSDCDGDAYSPAGGDCNDASAVVHPGAVELCNAADDDCDATIDEGAGTPGLGSGLAVGRDLETLSWPPQAGADSYDVQKGDLSLLLQSAGDFTGSTMACLANDFADTQLADHDRPRPGKGLYYLFRANGCGGQRGSYDDGAGQQGQRDAEIGRSSHACP